MDFTIENVCGFLIRSRLMTPEEMKAMYQRWVEAREPNASLGQFTRWLVSTGYVTEYQAGLLAKGHGEPDVYFLNQYRIMDRLGRGRMAGVYRAVHALGQTVAIKVLPPSHAKNPQMLGRFQREARLAMRLKHPNVVRSFQVGEAGGLSYLVMEHLEGETLEDVLARRKRLPPAEAVRVIHQALLGLQHIHEQGMVHRDLKPANLMLMPAPEKGAPDTTLHATVKILDIGLGRELFDERAVNPSGAVTELTTEGVLLGTPDYLAPEQARDPRNIDIRADIYSLGCVLFHALTAQPPFPDKNVLSQMVRHATEPAPPLRQFNPDIPDALQQIVNWMMAKKREDRYPNPERAAQALQVFLMADSPAAVVIEEAPQMRKYLTWLEMTDGPETLNAGEPAQDMVKAAPMQQKGAAAPAAMPPEERKKAPVTPPPRNKNNKNNKKQRKPSRGEARAIEFPMGKPYAAPVKEMATAKEVVAEEFDVELVPLSELPRGTPEANRQEPTESAVTPRARIMGLAAREWLLIGVGGGIVLALVAVGTVIALLLRS